MAAFEFVNEGQIHDGSAIGALSCGQQRFSSSESGRVQDADVVSVCIALECAGGRIGSEPALCGVLPTRHPWRGCRGPFPFRWVVLFEQRFSRSWSGIKNISHCCRVDSCRVLSSSWIVVALPAIHKSADSVYRISKSQKMQPRTGSSANYVRVPQFAAENGVNVYASPASFSGRKSSG